MNSNGGLGRLAGWIGLAGAFLVGVAEFLIQFNAAGGYEGAGYQYFKTISSDRLTLGYYIAVLSAPLYIVGYWFLERMAAHNEPLVNILRVAMVAVSVIWVVLILRGRTALPKWMAVFNPLTVLALIFGLYFAAPAIGVYILPVAMNVTHVVVFGLALLTCRKTASHEP